MPTLVESLKESLERVTKKYGSDRSFTKSLQRQIHALETGKDARQTYVGGGRNVPMPKPPTDKTEIESESRSGKKTAALSAPTSITGAPNELELRRAGKQIEAEAKESMQQYGKPDNPET